MKHLHNIFLLALISLVACNSNRPAQELEITEMMNQAFAEQAEGQDDLINGIIQSVPSPLELAAVIRGLGVEFNDGLMNSDKNKDSYESSYSKAFILGVYAGDLGYINMYEKSYLALNYLGAIKTLADDLKVGHFFDFATIRRMASNSDKVDSLLYISTSSFNKMDDYLRSQSRSHLSALILSGSWLEGLYIATEIASIHPADELVERIGEHKLVLDQVLFVLNAYKEEAFFGNLQSQFERIKEVYNGVSIVYQDLEPETKEVDGRLVIVNNSTSEVVITMEQLQALNCAVRDIRTALIAP